MNEPITLESLAARVAAVEAQLAAKAKPSWLNADRVFDQSPEAEEARQAIADEMARYRAQERYDLELDDPPQLVWKNWEHAVGVVTDPDLYAEVAAAGQAIRQAERDEARRIADSEEAA